MHPRLSDASPVLPAFVLALALLGALAVIGSQVLVQMRMAPGTVATTGAQTIAANLANSRAALKYGARTVQQEESGPGWGTLTTPQKLALYPLAERWALISETQKRRWLALAASFSSLPQEEQSKLHERMTGWASLSAQQRNQARLNYAFTNRLAPDDKRTQWDAYQALSAAEKRALAAQAAPRPRGAATALHPVSPKKLAQVPAATQSNPQRPNAPKIPPVVHHPPKAAVPMAPATTPSPALSTGIRAPGGTPPVVVETAPVSMPVAVPSPLPPLAPSSAESRATPTPLPITPDTSGLYPQ